MDSTSVICKSTHFMLIITGPFAVATFIGFGVFIQCSSGITYLLAIHGITYLLAIQRLAHVSI